MNEDIAISIKGLKKKYKLGAIGGGTLKGDLQSWWARKHGKEDPNSIVGSDDVKMGEEFYALNGIDLEVKKGEALGIIGMNGAGKSTLLKILSRVTAPSEGEVRIRGRITSMLEVGTGFHGELTGRENIYMNGAILGMTRKEVDEKIEEIIDFSECRQFIDTPVKRYSSGMYVKLAFAVAAHLDSEIMIMDEVLAVGDMKFQKKCLAKMGDEAQGGKTILYVSHNMATIRNLCSRCIILDKGGIIYDGEPEQAIEEYLGHDDSGLRKKYDLSKTKRAAYEIGKDFKFKELAFVKDVPIYSYTDIIRFIVDYDYKEPYDDARIFIHIYNADTGSPISLVISDIIDDLSGEKIFEFNPSIMAEGVYYFEIGAMRLLPNGSHITLDRTKERIYFQIMRDKREEQPKWNHSVYGSTIFPKLRITDVENI
ncbi:ABC transporter ATP-binding protein [Butyrivibrio sp. AD3002]|uniref:ABC transporter ATP-binding protein n=1 Tax=Butyrivibrio sp. AD3002 TaxID=1280670 RepID=UPI0003B52441|nr:ABC transporter ATP-binding protein [Butyrivibrio sp. AD3002]